MTTETLPATKPAGDLEPGDHVLADDIDPDGQDVAEVLFAMTYGAADGPFVSLMLSYGDTYEPHSIRLPATFNVTLASEADIADAKAEYAREKLADDLRSLATLVQYEGLPLPLGRLHIAEHLDSVDELVPIAKALAVEVEVGHKRYRSVTWPKGHKSYEPGLHVTWSAYAAEGPEPELKTDAAGMDYTRADTEDDPTPVSPARVPLHTGGVVNGDALVVDGSE